MITLSIPDMNCAHCQAAVRAAVAGVPGSEPVTVDLARREATVADGAHLADVLAALDRAGYPARVAD